MKQVLVIILTLVMMLSVLAGCNPSKFDDQTHNLETSQNKESSATSDETSQVDTPEADEDQQVTSSENSNSPDNNAEPLFKYDKYMITADARDFLSDREYSLYCQVIDSILSYNGVISGFASYQEFSNVLSVLFHEFVPVRNIIQSYANSSDPFLYEKGTATFKFIADKETCARNYIKFENIMNEALALINEDDSDWERIAKLYLYVSDYMDIGSPYESYGVKNDLYSCIVYKLGGSPQYASFLNMLANQIGFETIDGLSMGKNGFIGGDHCWSMIRVEGQWYHFDTCYQNEYIMIGPLWFFGLSTQERYNALANHSALGEPQEVEMFNKHDYKSEYSDLPYCEKGMSDDDREKLYSAVIADYQKES